MTLDDIYTPPEEAKEELMRRWEDKELRKKAEEFIGHTDLLPDYFFEKPHAISIEDLASPNLSTFNFRESAKKIGLDPLHFEFLEDIFVTRNLDKSALGKMRFYHTKDDNGDLVTSVERVIDMSGTEERKKFTDIKTLWGDSFVDFHHRIFFDCFPNAKVFDGSKWYEENGKKAKNYYENIFAMCLCHGILFEAFFYDSYEEKFTNEIVIPSFKKIVEHFKVRPLITKLIPMQHVPITINDKYWWCYPEYIKIKIREKNITKSNKNEL